MAALVTLAVAKQHLRIVDEDHNGDIQNKIDQASDIIVDYIESTTPTAGATTWTVDTVPRRSQAAVLLMLGHLWEHRGDADMAEDDALWQAIGRLLMRQRDPALA